MTKVNMLEAKTHLSRLVEAIESGAEKEVVIARNGKPVGSWCRSRRRRREHSGSASSKEKYPLDVARGVQQARQGDRGSCSLGLDDEQW